MMLKYLVQWVAKQIKHVAARCIYNKMKIQFLATFSEKRLIRISELHLTYASQVGRN